MPEKLPAEGLLKVPLALQPCVAETPSLQTLPPEGQHSIAFSQAVLVAIKGKHMQQRASASPPYKTDVLWCDHQQDDSSSENSKNQLEMQGLCKHSHVTILTAWTAQYVL